MSNLYETIRMIVQDEMRRLRVAEIGQVEEVHPHADEGDDDNFSCTVLLRDAGIVLKQVPVATGRIGTVAIPEAGESVLVQFLGGDLDRPVITGRLYDDEKRPPASEPGSAVWHLPLGAGDDEAVHAELISGEARSLTLKLGAGLELLLQDDDPVIEISVEGGSANIQIDRDGAITVESGGALSVKGSELTVEADGNITIEAGGDLTLNGATVNIN